MSYVESTSSARRKGSKRGQKSLNHLLNFNYERQSYSEFDNPKYRHKKKNKPISRSKEQFVLANFLFVVRPPSRLNNSNSGHYLLAKSDPDVLVEWSTIELIRSISNEECLCPICFEHPVAAKITKCGHVFCYHCILHYLSLGDSLIRKCPMCNELVTLDSLKSLQILPTMDGSDLRLLRRPKDSIIPCFMDEEETEDIFPAYDVPIARFSRYTIINDITPIIEKEIREMDEAMNTMELAESAYIQLGKDQVKARLDQWKQWVAVHLVGNYVHHVKHEHTHQQRVPAHVEAFGHDEYEEEHATLQPSSSQTHATSSLSQKIHNLSYYYYYQASDGQAAFLHPINFKMLLTEYHANMAELPTILDTDQTIEIEAIELTEEKRRMYAMVRHLPLGADIRFVEMDMSSYVSRSTMQEFQRTLQARENRRTQKNQKQQRELEEERRREEEEERIRAYEREQRILNLSAESFPQWKEVIEQASGSFAETQLEPTPERKKKTESKQTWGVKNITRTENEKIFGSSPQPVVELQGAWALRNSKQTNKPKKKKGNGNKPPTNAPGSASTDTWASALSGNGTSSNKKNKKGSTMSQMLDYLTS